MFIYHNSFDIRFRSPFGAAKTGSTVKLSLFTTEPVYATLIWFRDNHRMEIPMTCTPYVLDDKSGFMHSAMLVAPNFPCLLWYSFMINTSDGTKFYCGRHGEGVLSTNIDFSYQITVYEPFTLPDSYKNAIAYQIFPDRFAKGDEKSINRGIIAHVNRGFPMYIHEDWDEEVCYLPRDFEEHYTPCDFFCGDLYGIEQRIPYLKKFSVGCIYLNPIFLSPSNHRYDTADYMHVDDVLGGDEAYFSLRNAAEKAGITIMLDGVFSHTGADSIYFNKYRHFSSCGAYNSKESPYSDWYSFTRYPDEYKSWWGFTNLPETDEDNPSYREYISRVINKWKCSWRLDVADELTDDFMRFFRKSAKKASENSVVIGEVWEDASDKFSKGHRRGYTDGDMLDGVMNYPLRQWIIDFLLGKISAYDFVYNVMSQRENYPDEFLRGCLNILSSHDTVRILSVLCNAPGRDELCAQMQQKLFFSGNELTKGKKKVILSFVIQCAMIGVPCIYYGDEQGMQGMADPFCRRTFREDQSAVDFSEKVRIICETRSSHGSFMGEMQIQAFSKDIIIIRRYRDSANAYCVINRSESVVHVSTDAFPVSGVYRDVLSERVYNIRRGMAELELEPLEAVMLCSL
ncbi:MAG: glycoside hydrolase family 13 protein [Clostridia bacterium]|nr:glycoside hydrolase family 13 protein [Clostridia bacterium]